MLALSSAPLLGCTRIPDGRQAVTGFDIKGEDDVDEEDIEKKLATKETSKFLSLFRGIVYEYEVYDRYAVAEDLARIERYYRARGYYAAKVRVARVIQDANVWDHIFGEVPTRKVQVQIQVEEGEPVRIAHVNLEWTVPVSDDLRKAAETRARELFGKKRRPFDEEKFADAEKEITRAVANKGYAEAATTRSAEVDVAKNEATLHFNITPGEQSVFGEITFDGLENLPVTTVRRAFNVTPGKEYSEDALNDGRQSLLDLGVFSTVDVVPDLGTDLREAAPTHRKIVPIKVHTELSKLRTIKLGGGTEISSSRVDLHALIGWRNENTFGGLRRLELSFQPGVALWPTTLGNFVAPQKLLPFQRTRAALRQPAFFEARTLGLLSVEYGITPQLFPEQTQNVIGYHDVTTIAGVQRNFGHLLVRPSYGFQANLPYNVVGTAPTKLYDVFVSYLELFTALDYRNDKLKPTRGFYIQNTLQKAGGPLNGSADDVRIQPEVRGYIPITRRISVAVRGAVGFVFPSNYGEVSAERYRYPPQNPTYAPRRSFFTPPSSIPAIDPNDLSHDYQLMYFRGLFSGGPSSNRGYPLREVGPHDTIPYLVPSVSQTRGTLNCENNPNPPSECLLPTGGLSQWESSLELRFKVSGPLLAATFCDAGDVSAQQTDLRFDRLHLSCGAGARYDTPAGPIRLDIGYRIPGMQTLTAGPAGSYGEGSPSTILGLPIAINFGIGEAF